MTAPVHVIAAVIEREGRFLVARRPIQKRHGGLWEFPGGKFHEGEDLLSAARRELEEELDVRVRSVGPVELSIEDPASAFVIDFTRTEIEGEPTAREHDELAWAAPADLLSYRLAPSDRRYAIAVLVPAVNPR